MAKIFTKKVVLIMLAVVIAAAGVIWAIVANIKPTFKSGITDVPAAYSVSGNGTASVMVDNYLYFVGDYVATSEITYGQNDYYRDGKVAAAGIYRVRIDGGKPVVNYEHDNTYYDENENKQEYTPDDENYNTVVAKVTDWDNIGKKNACIEAVVPKIAGHDNTAMWVFGNTLIYTSPNNLRNKVGALRSGYLDFFKVDLNGKNHKLLYSATTKDLTTADFTLWANATDNAYLLVNEGGTLQQIAVATGKVTQIATEVTAVAFPTVDAYRRQVTGERLAEVYGGVMNYVYYTKNRDSEATAKGNLMYRYQIGAGKDAEKIGDEGNADGGTTFAPVSVRGGQFVFSTVALTGQQTTAQGITKYSIVTDTTVNTAVEYAAVPRTDVGAKVGESGNYAFYAATATTGVCLQNNKLHRYTVTAGGVQIDETALVSDVTAVLTVMGGKVYLRKESTVEIYAVADGQRVGSAVLGSDETDGTVPLPVAVLLPAHNEGSPASAVNLLYTHSATAVRLYAVPGDTNYYLKIK